MGHTEQGFTKKERRHYQAQIENQIIEQMQKLIVRGREFIDDDQKQYSNLEISSDAQDSAHYIEHLRSDSTLNHLIARHIAIFGKMKGFGIRLNFGVNYQFLIRALISLKM